MKVSVLVVSIILCCSMLVGCNSKLASYYSSSSEEYTQTVSGVTLSENEEDAIASSMKIYLYEEISEECLSMVDEDSFGVFIGFFDGAWDITVCVKERQNIIPMIKELFAALSKRLERKEMTESDISVKYYNEKDPYHMLVWKLTDGKGIGTLTDMDQEDGQVVREKVPYDEIDQYVDAQTGDPIDVPQETEESTR